MRGGGVASLRLTLRVITRKSVIIMCVKATQLSRTLKIGLFVFLCCMVLSAAQGGRADVPLPQVTGPIPVTANSYPFNSLSHLVFPQDLSQFGYVEEEYFVSGHANVYDLDELSGRVIVRTANAPYTTRVLVRRPVSPSAFSGTVIVELLNPTPGFDTDPQWQLCHDYFLAHGDAWVGITSKPVAVKALKHFDPQRYAPLSWRNPLPLWQTCTDPYSPGYSPGDSMRATENGLVWDIMSQVGALLKSPPFRNHPLQGFQVERVFATGYSQTGGFLVTYINFIRPLATAHLDDGTPVYDGYLIGDGEGGSAPLNQCAETFAPGDPRIIIQPRPEPVISVVTQTLVAGWSRLVRRADSDLPGDRYRRYEVPGSSHRSKLRVDFSMPPEVMARLGLGGPPSLNCIEVDQYGLSDFPLEYLMKGAFANLDAWVQDPQGYIPPSAPWINLDESNFFWPVLDAYGNATGGLRTPYLDVPVATYYAHSTAGDDESMFICSISGYKVPFDACLLMELYPPSCFLGIWFCRPSNSYVTQVREKVEELVDAGFITVDDGERIISEAETMQSQLPYRRWRWRCLPSLTAPEPGP